MDGLLEKKAYKDIVFDWAASHGFTPVESEINDLLWRLEKIVSGELSPNAVVIPSNVLEGMKNKAMDLPFDFTARQAGYASGWNDCLDAILSQYGEQK